MTYDPNMPPSDTSGDQATSETPAWDAGDATPHEGASEAGRDWLGQLQSMIDNLATQATPVMREIGAKAAELAAAAGEKAGPFAHKAAEVTEKAGVKVAERGRELATELRRDKDASMGGGSEPAPGAGSNPVDGASGMAPDSADSLGE